MLIFILFRHIAISVHGAVRIYSISDFSSNQFNPMLLLNQRFLSLELIKSLNWSSDGQLLVCGGEDCVIRVFSAFHQFENVNCAVLSRRFPIVATFFNGNDYDVKLLKVFLFLFRYYQWKKMETLFYGQLCLNLMN